MSNKFQDTILTLCTSLSSSEFEVSAGTECEDELTDSVDLNTKLVVERYLSVEVRWLVVVF